MKEDEFLTLFGSTKDAIKNTCIISPFINREMLMGLRIEQRTKGALYSVGWNNIFSLIVTKMGAPFIGDAVLYLQDTPCEHLILFGLCGALPGKGIERGTMYIVQAAFSQDSFVNMLLKRECQSVFYPDESIVKALLNSQDSVILNPATCLSVGSLKLEEAYLDNIQHKKIDLVDMETAAFYLAAKHVNKKGVSILIVTDILKEYPYYKALDKTNLLHFRKDIGLASEFLYGLIVKKFAK